jgi:hypothetical protein
MAFLLMGAGAVLLGAGIVLGLGGGGRVSCVESHSEDGLNYPWLRHVHGGLAYVAYEEPPGTGVWRRYTRAVWGAHCRAVSHDPASLVAAHMRAFVDPQTRFARLMFHFNDGTVMEPVQEFYELEARWIALHGH